MPRGRTRDEEAHRRILDAAFRLVGESDPGSVTINEIADAAKVGKQTIYRWWPSKTAVVLDALVDGSMRATPFPETEDIRDDFVRHLRAVIRLFRSPTGSIIRELLAEVQGDDVLAAEFRARFWAPRRDLSEARLRRGMDRGIVRPDLDVELVLDVIYGPLWLRLFMGHIPLRPAHAAAVVDAVWDGILVPGSSA